MYGITENHHPRHPPTHHHTTDLNITTSPIGQPIPDLRLLPARTPTATPSPSASLPAKSTSPGPPSLLATPTAPDLTTPNRNHPTHPRRPMSAAPPTVTPNGDHQLTGIPRRHRPPDPSRHTELRHPPSPPTPTQPRAVTTHHHPPRPPPTPPPVTTTPNGTPNYATTTSPPTSPDPTPTHPPHLP